MKKYISPFEVIEDWCWFCMGFFFSSLWDIQLPKIKKDKQDD